MVLLRARTPLTPAERVAKRRLVLQDTLALLTLFAITVALAVVTFLLFRSYSQHQQDAAARWLRRGHASRTSGKPLMAVYALRSALAYNPGNRATEIELAQALAEAGKVQEATSYFNTLWESEPGNGIINLQLARLTLKSNLPRKALEYYHAAIYGTWEGDGAVRRRAVRLELVEHLLDLNMFADARNELLIAAGNADGTEVQDRLRIASLLMAAHAPSDALRLYKEIAAAKPSPPEALAGAGHAAFILGRYREATQYLQRATTESARANLSISDEQLAIVRSELAQATRLLELYPSPSLPRHIRAARVLANRSLALKRFNACQGAAAATAGPLAALAARWTAEPRRLTESELLRDSGREAQEIALTNDTELAATQVCGAPTGDDALLLRIAQAPDAVEQP